MKPQLIRAEQLTSDQQQQVGHWLKANGCPYMVPHDAPIKVTGNHFIVEAYTIKRIAQMKTMWPRFLRSGQPWPEHMDSWYPPTKVRKYRIRHELRLT